MKQFFTYITVITAAARLCSCSDKLPEELPPDEPAIEQPFLELDAEDFSEITLNISITNASAPFKMSCIDFSDIDLGERLSPCKAEEYRDLYLPYKQSNYPVIESETERQEKWYEVICSQNAQSSVNGFAFHNGMIYLSVDYDDLCDYVSHESSLYRYDPDSGVTTELFRHSDPEHAFRLEDLCFIGDELYLTVSEKAASPGGTLYPKRVYRFDFQSGKPELLPGQSEHDDYSQPAFLRGSSEKLTVQRYGYTSRPGYFEYDPDSRSWKEITEQDLLLYGSELRWYDQLLSGVQHNSDRTVTVYTDTYSLQTDRNSKVIAADDDRVFIVCTDKYTFYSKSTLYVYDIAKHEKLIMDITDLSDRIYPFGNNLLCRSGTGYWYYLVPELGTAFPITEALGGNALYRDGDILYYADIHSQYRNYIIEDGSSYISSGENSLRKLWYIREEDIK